MKKLFYCVAAFATVFFAGSCQRENLEPVAGNGQVTFTVEAPAALQTRAIADGLNVNELIYEVWLTNDNEPAQKLYQATTTMKVEGTQNRATLTLDLVNDQKFTVLFWAQVANTGAYNTDDLKAVSYAKTEYSANDESLAAFYGVAYVDDCQHVSASGDNVSSEVTLRRPFAQLNIGTLTQEKPYKIEVINSSVTVTGVNTEFNVATGDASAEAQSPMTFAMAAAPSDPSTLTVNDKPYRYAGMNYLFESDNVEVEYNIETSLNGSTTLSTVTNTISEVPLKENYRTNIIGNLLTSEVDYEIVVEAGFYIPAEDIEVVTVSSAVELTEAIEAAATDGTETNIKLEDDINLNDLLTRSTESAAKLTISATKNVVLHLNGKTLYGTSNVTGKNFEMIDVRGNLTVADGTVTAEFLGENMGWGASTNVFNITAGGVLNLNNVTVKNLGGSDMAFVAHLNNWGDATLNVENSTLESPYIAVRVFNSGPQMNYVTIKNSTLKGKYCFWVHNYKKAGDATGDDSTLAFDIFNGTNTFEYTGKAPVLYGFNDPIYCNANGCQYVNSLDAFKSAVNAGTSVALESDIDFGTTQLAVTGKNQVVDLNGHTLTTRMTHGGIALKNGASIINGTIEHTSTVAAIKAFSVGRIENVTIKTTCQTADKTITAIAVQQGGYVGSIKDVTIEGVSQGIEVGYQATVDLIEDVIVEEKTNGTANGIALVINGGKVGLAKNSVFKGDAYGVTMHLKGVFNVALELENCVVEGTTASIYAWDEKGISNTSGSLTLTYDKATVLNGPFVWDFEEECQGVVTLNRPE